ncbi:MAG TPA: CorA family divalent cation transporter [Candidatus Paceibacterota bacterium]
MINRHIYKNLVWIDLESPTHEEIEEIAGQYKIGHLVTQELARPSFKPKVETYPDYIYLILHFPVIRHSHSLDTDQEIDFILGKDFLITAHYDTVDPLHKFSRIFEVNSILDKSNIGDHAGFIFFYMMRELYTSLANELEFVFETLKDIEARIFRGKEKEMVFALSNVSRILLDFRQATIHHKDILDSFDEPARALLGNGFGPYVRATRDEYFKVTNTIRSHGELLSELRETNNSLLNTKQNEIMRHLTMMAFVTFPLSLVVALLAIDTEYNPVLGLPQDFWLIAGIIVFGMASIIVYFKWKKWL